MSTTSTTKRNIVIIGGGIIGCTTAYYLSHHPSFDPSWTTITIIEASAHGAAQGASGKAGGLVAKWAYPKELVGVSFPEHVRLAEKHNGAERWGWRFVACGNWEGHGESTGVGVGKSLEKTLGLDIAPEFKRAKTGLPPDLLNWVNPECTQHYSPMAPPGSTAQVHPYQFTTSMLDFATAKGATFVQGKVTAVLTDKSTRAVTGVTYTPHGTSDPVTVPVTHVVLAAGVWSPRVLPNLPIQGTRAHSITIRPKDPSKVSPHILFTEITLPPTPSPVAGRVTQATATPEIYPRPNGEVYVCGPGDHPPVPDSVDDVKPDLRACEDIWQQVASISRVLKEGDVDARQACFLPVVSTPGGPIIGEASHVAKGLVIATGHTCWGICNAPGTGRAISELIMDGRIKCANLQALYPAKFM